MSTSIITREVNSIPVAQRINDGYFNLTKMARAEDRLISTYLRLDSTKAFLEELSIDVQICTSDLVQVKKGGIYAEQGTWGHPQVAIHCAQWCSPKFAVLVSRWVFDWMARREEPKLVEAKAIAPTPQETTIDVVATPVVESFALPTRDRMSLLKEAIDIGNQLGGFDDRQKVLIKDQLMNLLMQERLLGSATPALPPSEHEAHQTTCPRLELPISDRCVALGFNADSKQLLKIGRAAANLYRNKYGDAPRKREQFVHGATRMVNVYTEADIAILDEAIKSVMAA
jgi:hypothetical protein